MDGLRSKFDTVLSEEERGENWFPEVNRNALKSILVTLPPGAKVLEIGSWLGRSACFILEVNPNVDLHCVDTWEDWRLPEDEVKKESRRVREQFLSNLAKLGITDKIKVIEDDSKNILQYLPKGTLDMIYIDGSHKEEEVYLDMRHSYSLLKLGGHIVGDDWGWNSVSKGIMRAFWETNEVEECLSPIRSFASMFHTQKIK